MKSVYLFFSLLFIILTFLILQVKGYFAVRGFIVENRPDIEKYTNQNFSKSAFIFVSKADVELELKKHFLDIESLTLSRRPDLTVHIGINSKIPFAKSTGNNYVSTDGFYYNVQKPSITPDLKVKVDNDLLGQYVLSKDQVYFISYFAKKDRSTYVEIIDRYHFILYYKDIPIEVEKDHENIANMPSVVEDIINNQEGSLEKLVVLNTRVVVK